MGWTYSVIWFLSVWECFSVGFTDSLMRGEIQSTLYPLPYPTGLKREWNILGCDGHQIQLSITHLDIKPSAGCSQDSLTVVYDQQILGRFCSQENSTDHPGKEPIRSPGNRLTLIFQSSNSNSEVQQHIGFSATYKSIGINCGKPEPLLNGGMINRIDFENYYRSVVQYHCNEPYYSLPEDANVCGKPTQILSEYQRIIGGKNAPDNTIPWQVLLSVGGARGGGMVIADRWIMTAANVVVKDGIPALNDSVRVSMGLTHVRTLMVSPVYAASVHIHPDYNNPQNVDFNNDIALIKLQDPITFKSSVMPICLPAQDATYATGTMGLVSGFGVKVIDGKRFLTNQLNYVQVPVVDQETCTESITLSKQKPNNNIPSLTNNMFCAGDPLGGKDSCHGDSGGPYALMDDGRFWAAGIVSWGEGCGVKGSYGVYTRVTNYLDWIKKTMQEN